MIGLSWSSIDGGVTNEALWLPHQRNKRLAFDAKWLAPKHGVLAMERSLPAGRNEGALVVLADGGELPEHAGQAAVDLAVVALVAEERPDARVGVRYVAALPGLAPAPPSV